jgi:hypothetical protein
MLDEYDYIFPSIPLKTPQLIGILLGCLVFFVTMFIIIFLLIQSGTLQGAIKQMQDEATGKTSGDSKPDEFCSGERVHGAELHNHVIEAANRLAKLKDIFPKKLEQVGVKLELYDSTHHVDQLEKVSNGCAIFHEPSYDPKERLFQYLDPPHFTSLFQYMDSSKVDTNISSDGVCDSQDQIHLVIKDSIIDHVVGMVSLVNNNPKNLTISIANLWLTPAYQSNSYSRSGAATATETSSSLFAQNALYMILNTLFSTTSGTKTHTHTHTHGFGYRRITIEISSILYKQRKFLLKCGFQLESIKRKDKIISNKYNQDTCVYVIINNEWDIINRYWKKSLGLPTITTERERERETEIAAVSQLSLLSNNSSSSSSSDNSVSAGDTNIDSNSNSNSNDYDIGNGSGILRRHIEKKKNQKG